jgi:hypothetical protein
MEKLELARREARRYYRATEKKDGGEGYPYSPADATKSAARKSGLPASRLVPVVAAVYYEENGSRSPLPASAAKGAAALARAIRSRRDAGGRLGRWEVVAASAAATLGRPVPVAAVRALYEKGGGDLALSYTGRGTRVGAPATREDETAEIEATLS